MLARKKSFKPKYNYKTISQSVSCLLWNFSLKPQKKVFPSNGIKLHDRFFRLKESIRLADDDIWRKEKKIQKCFIVRKF